MKSISIFFEVYHSNFTFWISFHFEYFSIKLLGSLTWIKMPPFFSNIYITNSKIIIIQHSKWTFLPAFVCCISDIITFFSLMILMKLNILQAKLLFSCRQLRLLIIETIESFENPFFFISIILKFSIIFYVATERWKWHVKKPLKQIFL